MHIAYIPKGKVVGLSMMAREFESNPKTREEFMSLLKGT